MHVITYGCELEFQDEILLREECKTQEKAKNFKFSYEGQNDNFSRSRMTKRTSPLKSSHEI